MIREATLEDLEVLTHIGEKFFNMTDLGKVTDYDPESLTFTLKGLIDGDSGVILVAEKNGKIIGVVGAVLAPFYFNLKHIVCQEFFWYVLEEHRGGSTGGRLFMAAERWAKDNGADSMCMVALGCNYEEVSRFYIKKDYFKQETNFLRRL